MPSPPVTDADQITTTNKVEALIAIRSDTDGYDEASIAQHFADMLGLAANDVTVTVSASTVTIEATVADAQAAAAKRATLEQQLATPAAAASELVTALSSTAQPAVELSLTVAGTVESFDQDSFKAKLAASLNVTIDAISLAVSAASVLVVASIAVADEVAAVSLKSTVETVASDAAALGEVVDVTVESVSAPVVVAAVEIEVDATEVTSYVESSITYATSSPPPPSPAPSPLASASPSSPPVASEENLGAIVGGVVGALAVAIVIIGAIAYRMRRPRADTALTLGGETKPEAEKEKFVLEPTSQI